ncbi:polyprenyl synthetase family protein [Streptomyces chromofuscus]|uniref:polyprenyl synthetase family protein n=1 Tax=Streptomyces chromofuscus TaxID=42881 RepID=UPI00167C1512|nr:polyprenyl synthetase family protein [Streptomyces chromofuscus]GGT43226.1 (2E,6E)-farnesyl diphosphate synthase [Streptomyces chromofuscus]
MKLPPVLESAGARIVPALRSTFAELSPEIRAVVDYHMGWRDAQGNAVEKQSSKGVRPALALLAAAAADNLPVETAIPGAVAVEAMHNCAFLLDDVMDGDRFRRQRETAWVVFGEGMSTLSGASLFTLGSSTLARSDSPNRHAAVSLYHDTFATMLAGQAIDLQMEGATDVSVDRCLQMTEWKTASLMRCATTMGAVLACAPDEVLAALRTYGETLGVAFQARDDLLGIWGQPHQTGGRPPGFDLRARKATLPVAFALEERGAVADELRQLLVAQEQSDEDIARAAKLVESGGGRARTAELAETKVDEALTAVRALNLPTDIRTGFEEIAEMGRPDY